MPRPWICNTNAFIPHSYLSSLESLLFTEPDITWLHKLNILLRRNVYIKRGRVSRLKVPDNLQRFSLFNLLPNSCTGEIAVRHRLYLTVACKYYMFCSACYWPQFRWRDTLIHRALDKGEHLLRCKPTATKAYQIPQALTRTCRYRIVQRSTTCL
jgi:hypothetical protein